MSDGGIAWIKDAQGFAPGQSEPEYGALDITFLMQGSSCSDIVLTGVGESQFPLPAGRSVRIDSRQTSCNGEYFGFELVTDGVLQYSDDHSYIPDGIYGATINFE